MELGFNLEISFRLQIVFLIHSSLDCVFERTTPSEDHPGNYKFVYKGTNVGFVQFDVAAEYLCIKDGQSFYQ